MQKSRLVSQTVIEETLEIRSKYDENVENEKKKEFSS